MPEQAKKGCSKRRRVHAKGVHRIRRKDTPCIGYVGDGYSKWLPARAEKKADAILQTFAEPDES